MGQTCCGTNFLENSESQEIAAYERRDGKMVEGRNLAQHRALQMQEAMPPFNNQEIFRDPTYQDSVERYNVVYRKVDGGFQRN